MHWIGSENKLLWAINPRRLLRSHMINTLYYELNPQSRRQSQLRVWGFPLNLVRLRIRTLWIAISETSSEIHFIQMLLVTVLAQRGNLNPELATVWRIWSMSLNIHEGSIVRMGNEPNKFWSLRLMPKHEINSNILYRQSQSASLEVLGRDGISRG